MTYRNRLLPRYSVRGYLYIDKIEAIYQLVQQSKGDVVIWTEDIIYIFEFKLNQTAQSALQQIQSTGYATKYQHHGKKIICVGANFDTNKRMVVEWVSR